MVILILTSSVNSSIRMSPQPQLKLLLGTGLIICAIFNFALCNNRDRCTRNHIGFETNSIYTLLPPCVGSIENLMKGRFRSGVAEDNYEVTPAPWLNATLATIGQKFAENNWFAVNIAMIMAELVVAAQPDTFKAIWPTGSADNLEKSVRRFAANILQDSTLYKENLFSPKTNAIESMSKIRAMHLTNIHKHSVKSTSAKPTSNLETYKIDQVVWDAFDKDLRNSKIPAKYRVLPPQGGDYSDFYLNQFAMASTLWGLSAMPIIRSEEFGIPIGTDEELEGFLQFWAFVGHGVGIEDQFNLCLQPNLKEAKIYFERLLNELLVPYLFHLEYEAKVLIEVAAIGFTKAVGPVAQFGFILRRMLEDVVGIPATHSIANMNPMARTVDMLYRTLKPTMMVSRTMRGAFNLIYEGYIQNLSKREFGFDGSNKTIVAQKAFSW